MLGISVCGDYETWKYYIAVATSETAKFEFEKLIIPASKWAIFSGKGTNVSLQDLERRVITEWVSHSLDLNMEMLQILNAIYRLIRKMLSMNTGYLSENEKK